MPTKPAIYHSITPYLTTADPAAAVEFYQSVFGAEQCLRLEGPDGMIVHAEIKIGDTRFMIGGEYPDMDIKGPGLLGGSPVLLYLYVDDLEATLAQAVAAGATVLVEPEDQFHGDRTAKMADPAGHIWMLGQVLEEVSDEEVTKRFNAMMGG